VTVIRLTGTIRKFKVVPAWAPGRRSSRRLLFCDAHDVRTVTARIDVERAVVSRAYFNVQLDRKCVYLENQVVQLEKKLIKIYTGNNHNSQEQNVFATIKYNLFVAFLLFSQVQNVFATL